MTLSLMFSKPDPDTSTNNLVLSPTLGARLWTWWPRIVQSKRKLEIVLISHSTVEFNSENEHNGLLEIKD